MRFRAEFVDIHLLHNVCSCLEKIDSRFILRLTSSSVHVIIRPSSPDSIQVWGKIPQETLFSSYRCTSQANHIGLEIETGLFTRALRSGKVEEMDISIRLKKIDDQPSLVLDFVSKKTCNSLSHSVPVRVLISSELDELLEPSLSGYLVQACLPPIKEVRSVVERMKNISDVLKLTAFENGELQLSVENLIVSMTTHYRGLDIQFPSDGDAEEEERSLRSISTQVHRRLFSLFLLAYGVHPSHAYCYILDNVVVCAVFLGTTLIYYLIPVHASDEDL